MRRHRIAGTVCVLLMVGACTSDPPSSMEQSPATQAGSVVTVLASEAPASTGTDDPGDIAQPTAPEITEATVVNDAFVFHVAKPHVSEAVEYYQVRLDEGLWRALDASEWRMVEGEAGIVVTLRGLDLTPGQPRLVQLRAVSLAGFGPASPVAWRDNDVAVDNPDRDSTDLVDIDSAMGLDGSTGTRTLSDPVRQVIVILVEVLAALGLVFVGILIGWRLRRT